MKNILIKIGAIASLGVGALLIIQPVWANQRQSCRSDGGYHETHTGTGCSFTSSVNNGRVTYTANGTCGGRRVPKGSYCAKDQSGLINGCNDLGNTQPATAESYEGSCMFFTVSPPNSRGETTTFSYKGIDYDPGVDNGHLPLGCLSGHAPWHPSERVMIGACSTRV